MSGALRWPATVRADNQETQTFKRLTVGVSFFLFLIKQNQKDKKLSLCCEIKIPPTEGGIKFML
jgi:hypothetical protein